MEEVASLHLIIIFLSINGRNHLAGLDPETCFFSNENQEYFMG